VLKAKCNKFLKILDPELANPDYGVKGLNSSFLTENE